MSVDLSESLDFLYQGADEKVAPEVMKTIVDVLRRAELGASFKKIASEVNLTPDEVKNLVIRNRGWEAGDRQQRGHQPR